MTKWVGEEDIGSAFEAFGEESDAPSSSCSSVKHAVSICLKHSAEYKMVVFEIEKRMKATSSSTVRLKALFVIEGICSQAKGKLKEQMITRFGGRMRQICALLEEIEGEEHNIYAQIVSSWKKQSTFSDSVLPDINSAESVSSSQGPDSSSSSDGSRDKERKKESVKQKQNKSSSSSAKIIKYCSFREGSCPFGEKCRFSHAAQGANYVIAKRPISRLEDSPQLVDFSKTKYAKISIESINTSKIPHSVVLKTSGDEDKINTVTFTRNTLDAYTTRSDVQVSFLTPEDFAKLY